MGDRIWDMGGLRQLKLKWKWNGPPGRRALPSENHITKTQLCLGVLIGGVVEDDDGAVLVDPAEGGAAAAVAQGDEVTVLIGGAEVSAPGAGDENGPVER